MSMDDPWKVLKLKPTKDKQLISHAWRKLASQYHPDHGGDPELFKLLRAAYEQALAKSNTVIEITKTANTVPVAVTLGCSDVLRPQYITVKFDYLGEMLECSVLIPEWETEWGRKKSILVRTNQINLMVNITVEDDELEWQNGMLLWRPQLDLVPVLETRTISATWDRQLLNLEVDDNGHAVLISQGYKINEGDRLDIIVQPKYIWPKKNPC